MARPKRTHVGRIMVEGQARSRAVGVELTAFLTWSTDTPVSRLRQQPDRGRALRHVATAHTKLDGIDHIAIVVGMEIETERLVGTKEAAAFFGVRTTNFLRDLASRSDFPSPIAHLASTRVWRESDLAEFKRTMADPIRGRPKHANRAVQVLRPEIARLIPRVVDSLVTRSNPLRIIVFGSQARGDAGPDSDLDLLVVVPDGQAGYEAEVAMYQALAWLPMGKDIVVATPREIERFGNLHGTVLRPALEEGVAIYG